MSTTATTMRRRTSSTTSRDPVTAVLIVIVACTTLVQSASAAPAPASFNADFDSWWFNACDHSEHRHKPKHNGHNTRCDDLSSNRIKVKPALKIFMSNFRKELKSINNTYKKAMKNFAPYSQPAYEWLPNFKKPATNSKEVLQQFHSDLQKYAVAIHYLVTRRLLDTEAKFAYHDDRKRLLIQVLNHLKSLLCEVETAVNETCQEVPKRIHASLAKDEGLSDIANSLTDLHIVDSGVLTRFNTFMRRSKAFFNNYFPRKPESNSDESEWDLEESATPSAEADGEW